MMMQALNTLNVTEHTLRRSFGLNRNVYLIPHIHSEDVPSRDDLQT